MKSQQSIPEQAQPEMEPRIVTVDTEGKEQSAAILDESDIAYDPGKMTMDLTKAEKRRTTALMLAIQAYDRLIIKDAEMYNAVSRDRERQHAPVIQPATMNAMVLAAIQFDAFIAGTLTARPEADESKPEVETPEGV